MIGLRDKHLLDGGTACADGHCSAADLEAAVHEEGVPEGLTIEHVSQYWVIEIDGRYEEVARNTPGAMPVTIGRLTRRDNA